MLSILLLIALPHLANCGTSTTGGAMPPPPKDPIFTGSGTASAPNLVTLSGGEPSPGSLIPVYVKIAGPTTSSDLFSFSFNIALSDPSIVRSVTSMQGDALVGQQAVVTNLNGNLLVIGVSRLGGTGNGVGASGGTLLGLVFRMDPTKPGTTTLTFDSAKVLDHTGAPITTIQWDPAAAQIQQPK